MPKLNVWALSSAFSITWTFGVVLLGITALFGWGAQLVSILGNLYIGYNASMLGILIGALWAALDGFVFGFLFAVIYNWLLAKSKVL